MPLCFNIMEAAGRVCACVWRGGVIWFPRLILCFSPLVSWNTTGRAAARVNRCDHQRRQQDETQEGAWFPNIWQGKASDSLNLRMKKGPQICRDQSVPWVPEPLWPPSTYSNGVSWRRHKQTSERKRGREKGSDEYICARFTQNMNLWSLIVVRKCEYIWTDTKCFPVLKANSVCIETLWITR